MLSEIEVATYPRTALKDFGLLGVFSLLLLDLEELTDLTLYITYITLVINAAAVLA